MKVHLILDGECIEIDTITITISEPNPDRFCPYTEKKWIKFCKDHRLSPTKHYRTKWYWLYLELCAENML